MLPLLIPDFKNPLNANAVKGHLYLVGGQSYFAQLLPLLFNGVYLRLLSRPRRAWCFLSVTLRVYINDLIKGYLEARVTTPAWTHECLYRPCNSRHNFRPLAFRHGIGQGEELAKRLSLPGGEHVGQLRLL